MQNLIIRLISEYNVSNLLTQEILQEVRKFVPSRKKIMLDYFLGSIPSIAGIPIGQLITTSGSVRELIEYKHTWLALFLKLRRIEHWFRQVLRQKLREEVENVKVNKRFRRTHGQKRTTFCHLCKDGKFDDIFCPLHKKRCL